MGFVKQIKFLVLYLFLYFSLTKITCMSLRDDTRLTDRPGKSFCLKENYYKDVNCSNQVESHSGGSCLMKYLNRTSKECSETGFKGGVDTTGKYGEVKLTPMVWFEGGLPFSSVNVTFSNIGWERTRMRFVEIGSVTPQICREFVLSGDVASSSVISFDCLWGNGSTAGREYKFDYLTMTEDSDKYLYSYLVRIPEIANMNEYVRPEDYHLFLMVDETAFPEIGVMIQVPPKRLNATTIDVELFYKKELDGFAKQLRQWTVNVTGKPQGEFIRVDLYDTGRTPGYYYFNATFHSSYCNTRCKQSSTPLIEITGLRLSVQVIIAIVILSLAVLGLISFLLWQRKYKKFNPELDKPANVLFVYESSYPSHIENIYKFKEFLEENCYLAPKLDLIDIPNSDSMNPWRWYYNAFEEANYVLVFASPRPEAAEVGIHEDNIYQNLHAYALRLLTVHLINKHRFQVAKVRLPGCAWDAMPPETLIVSNKFALPEKLSHLFKFLNVPPVMNGGSKLLLAMQRPRTAPRLSVVQPVAPLALPFDAGNFDTDEVVLGPLTVNGVVFNLDSKYSSEDDDEDMEMSPVLAGFNL